MPAAGLPWTQSIPSRERRRWLLAASALCALLAAVLCLPLLASPVQPTLWAAIAAAGGGALAALLGARRPPAAIELRVDADGTPWVRPVSSEDAAERAESALAAPAALRARPLHVSARLITLGSPLGTLALWRDSLPQQRFRQLATYARWHVERPPQPGANPVTGT